MFSFFVFLLYYESFRHSKASFGLMCCSGVKKAENIEVYRPKAENFDENIKNIIISPSIDGVFDISQELIKRGYNVSYEKPNQEMFYLSTKGKNPKNFILETDKFNFINDIELYYDVYSSFACIDTAFVCHFEKTNLFVDTLILSLIFVVGFLIFAIQFNPYTFTNLTNDISFFDENGNPLFVSELKDRFHEEALEHVIELSLPSKTIKSTTIRNTHGISNSHFDRAAAIRMVSKKRMYMVFFWIENLPGPSSDVCPFDVRLKSKTKELASTSEVYLKSFREYRPIRVEFELTTGQRGSLEFPVNAITSLEPFSNIFTIVTSIFLDCYNFMTENPYSADNLTHLLQKYLPMIKSDQVYFLDEKWQTRYEFQLASAKKVEVSKLIQFVKENEGKEIIDDVPIDGVRWLYVVKAETAVQKLTIVLCFHCERPEKFVLFACPVVALSVAFVMQMSLSRQISLEFNNITDMLANSEVFAFYEYNSKTKKTTKIRKDFKDILHTDLRKHIENLHTNESIVENDDNDIIYFQKVSKEEGLLPEASSQNSPDDEYTVSILAEDMSTIKSQVHDMVTGQKTAIDITNSLNFHCIYTQGEPRLIENDDMLLMMGFDPSTTLLDIVHKNDLERFKQVGQNQSHISGNNWYEIASKSIGRFKGGEKRFTPSFTQLTQFIDKRSSEHYPLNDKGEAMCFRIVDKNGAAHWYICIANADVGFIFSAKSILGSVLPALQLKGLVNAPSSVIIWGVILQNDQVVSVFEMPTIWDELSIDKDTPFSNFTKFLRDPPQEVEQDIDKICEGKLQACTHIVYLLRPGGVLRRGRLSISRIRDSLICAFLDLEDFSDTTIRVKEQTQTKSFLLKAGNMGIWRFQDNNDKADNVLLTGESKTMTLNWSFVDNQIISEEMQQLFTTRMRNSMDLAHAFEIDMQLADGRYVAMRGKQTARHVVTGLVIEISCIEKSNIFKLLNGRPDTDEIISAIEEIRKIFEMLDTRDFNEEQVAAVEEVLAAADEIITAENIETQQLQKIQMLEEIVE